MAHNIKRQWLMNLQQQRIIGLNPPKKAVRNTLLAGIADLSFIREMGAPCGVSHTLWLHHGADGIAAYAVVTARAAVIAAVEIQVVGSYVVAVE